MANTYEIRDRDIGGILDEAIFLFRDHFGFLALVAGLFIFPFVLSVDLLSLYLVPDEFVFNPETGLPPDQQMESMAGIWAAAMFVGAGLNFLSIIGISLADVTVAYGIGHRYLGYPVSFRDALRNGLRLLLKMILLQFVVGLMVGFAACFCIIPGLVVNALFFLFPPVLVLENATMSNALARSTHLVRGFVWHTVALILVLVVIEIGIGAFSAIIPSMIVLHVLYAMTQAAYRAFESVVRVVLYFSARCRLENLDIELLADRVDVPPATGEAIL